MKVLNKPAARLTAIALIQITILLSILAFKQYTVWTSDTVLLRVGQLVPIEVQSGDYVTARYEISSVDSLGRNRDGEAFYGTVYVELTESADGYWRAEAIHDRRDRDDDKNVLISGDVGYPYYDPGVQIIDYATYEISYDIEWLFVASDDAGSPPTAAASGIAVEVRLDRFGNAEPLRLFVDGRAYDVEKP